MVRLINQLEPHVSVFSATLPEREHGDDVVVGGKVTGMLNMMSIVQDTSDKELKEEGIYITIDDEIGETELCIPQKAFHRFEETFKPLAIGDVILAKGRVYHLNPTHTYEGPKGKKITVDKEEEKTLRVVASQVLLFPYEEAKTN